MEIFGKFQAGFHVMKKTPEADKDPKPETELENRQRIKNNLIKQPNPNRKARGKQKRQ